MKTMIWVALALAVVAFGLVSCRTADQAGQGSPAHQGKCH